MTVILATQEAKIRRIMVTGQAGQKSLQGLISPEKTEHSGVRLSSQ
jgi:hypothetical protein